MPIKRCTRTIDGKQKPGYKYGDSGHCYTYTPGDEKGRKEAKQQAEQQAAAIHASGYEKSDGPLDGEFVHALKEGLYS